MADGMTLVTRPCGRARRRGGAPGFTLVELLVTVAIIGIVTAIAVPNVARALQRSRNMAAYQAGMQLKNGLHQYLIEHDVPPPTLNVLTLEPLVSTDALTPGQAKHILSTFERGRVVYYWGGVGWWNDGGYYYEVAFRPKGEKDPEAMCWVWEDIIYRFDSQYGWHLPLNR